MEFTLVEKIFSAHVDREVRAGDVVVASVDFVFSHDGNRPQPMDVFTDMGADRVFDPGRVAMFLDHAPNTHTRAVAAMHEKMRTFARRQGMHFYEIGRGISHQVLAEEGHAVPGRIIVGSDSHSCTAGAFNLLGTGVGSTDLAVAMKEGKLWFKVPETIRVEFRGSIPHGVFAKDLALTLLGRIKAAGATYRALEFGGDAIAELDIHSRMTLTNLGVEMGAKFAVMPYDDRLAAHLRSIGIEDSVGWASDESASYLDTITIDCADLEPQVALPPRPDQVAGISSVAGRPIRQATIGTSTNGQLEDLRAALAVLGNHRIAPDVRLFVAPATRRAHIDALRDGLIERLVEAGALIGSPGCSGCTAGSAFGVPADGEAMITSAPRNFVGRTGNNTAEIYLASPATVMASAIEGAIADPRPYLEVAS